VCKTCFKALLSYGPKLREYFLWEEGGCKKIEPFILKNSITFGTGNSFFTDLEVKQFKHFNASEKDKNYDGSYAFVKNPLLLNKQFY